MRNIVAYLQDPRSEASIVALICENRDLYGSLDTEEKIDRFSGTLYNHFVRECVRDNQFITLSTAAYRAVHARYVDLIRSIQGIVAEGHPEEAIIPIVRSHRAHLIGIIGEEREGEERSIIVPCAEYSAPFQAQILRIEPSGLEEPVLDVGCGAEARLVRFLEHSGLAAYGVDQYLKAEPHIFTANWLEFDFIPHAWGSVISHMAFSNHFKRCLALGTDERDAYGRKYLEILDSLREGGRFIYTPALQGMEENLDQNYFEVTRYPNHAEDRSLDTVHVLRRRLR